jgi:hypothetical protein
LHKITIMQKVSILLFAILLSTATLLSCSETKNATTQNNSSEKAKAESYTTNILTPIIDGKANDWAESLFMFDRSSKTKYAVANDTNRLYIAIIAADAIQQMKMINGGTEIWIGLNIKKSKNIGIKFPIRVETMQMSDRNSDGPPDAAKIKKDTRSKMLKMDLKGFKPEFNGVQPLHSISQIKPAINWDEQNNMVYELSIPFSAFTDADKADLKNIIVGIVYNGLKAPEGMENRGGMPRGGPPGGGAPPAGMRPPGGGGAGMPDREQMQNLSKEISIWTKYSILK